MDNKIEIVIQENIFLSEEGIEKAYSYYKISEKLGFALYYDYDSIELPLLFKPYEEVALKMHDLIAENRVNEEILCLRIIEQEMMEKFSDEELLNKIFGIFTFLANAFLSANKSNDTNKANFLPKNLWIPLKYSSDILEFYPIYNLWTSLSIMHIKRPIFPLSYEDIELKLTFTNTETESNFFKASFLSHYNCKDIVKIVFNLNSIIYKYFENEKIFFEKFTTEDIGEINELLKTTNKLLEAVLYNNQKLFTIMNAEDFFYKIRLFLLGYEDVKVEGTNLNLNYYGSSAGQAPLFFLLKIMFGVNNPQSLKNYNESLLQGIRKPHLNFLKMMKKYSLIHMLKNHAEIRQNYENCENALKEFYKIHKEYVINFIVKPSKRAGKGIETLYGTGGTPIEFIKNIDKIYFKDGN